MSDRQNLAEHGTALCLAGLGYATGGIAAFAVPIAVFVAMGWDMWARCEKTAVRRAVKRAREALDANPDLTETDITAAFGLIQSNKKELNVNPALVKLDVPSKMTVEPVTVNVATLVKSTSPAK